MQMRKLTNYSIIIIIIMFSYNITYSGNTETTPEEMQEYRQDFKRIDDLNISISSLSYSGVRDLNAYEEFANEIEQKWRGRHREYYARLMKAICGPLSSGTFKENRRYELARKYALYALEEPDSIPLTLELELL